MTLKKPHIRLHVRKWGKGLRWSMCVHINSGEGLTTWRSDLPALYESIRELGRIHARPTHEVPMTVVVH